MDQLPEDPNRQPPLPVNQNVPVQPVQPVAPPPQEQVQPAEPIQTAPEQPPVLVPEPYVEPQWYHYFLNTGSWILLIVLAPITVLILISQNSLPGDMTYPIKRGLENGILAAASVHPATRAAFRTDLTTRRFNEAEQLLLVSADTKGLGEFIDEIQTTQAEIETIQDPVKKRELEQKVQIALIEYEERLTKVHTQLVVQAQTEQIARTQAPVSLPQQDSDQQQPLSEQPSLSTPTNTPTPTAIPTPTSTPIPSTPTRPAGTVVGRPTATPVLTAIPTSVSPTQPPATPTPAPLPPEDSGPIEEVGQVTDYIKCLQTKPRHECKAPEGIGGHSSRANSEEREEKKKEREEKKEEREKEQEREKDQKEDKDDDN